MCLMKTHLWGIWVLSCPPLAHQCCSTHDGKVTSSFSCILGRHGKDYEQSTDTPPPLLFSSLRPRWSGLCIREWLSNVLGFGPERPRCDVRDSSPPLHLLFPWQLCVRGRISASISMHMSVGLVFFGSDLMLEIHPLLSLSVSSSGPHGLHFCVRKCLLFSIIKKMSMFRFGAAPIHIFSSLSLFRLLSMFRFWQRRRSVC